MQIQQLTECCDELLKGNRSFFLIENGVIHESPDLMIPLSILSGSFNPLHDGHRKMAALARQISAQNLHFELSLNNADKSTLSTKDIIARINQQWGSSLIVSNVSTFVEKSRVFPGCEFVVGVDTLIRVADPRFYQNSPGDRDSAIRQIASNGCRFLVFGRLQGNRFQDWRSINIPSDLREICKGVEESRFRVDISSSQIRKPS